MKLNTLLAIASVCVVVVGCASPSGDLATETRAGGKVDAAVAADVSDTRAASGPSTRSSAASCVEGYAPHAVARRGFAFDGTVVGVGDGTTNRPGRGQLDADAVTFAVNTWFVGGPTSEVTIDMGPFDGGPRFDEVTLTYEVGSRLLVSGESRWGEGVLHDGLAWGCGFSRNYDALTADAWRAATA